MKKDIIRIALVAMTAFLMPTSMDAQLNDILNKVKDAATGNTATTTTVNDSTKQSSTSTGDAITNILGGIMGSSSTAKAATDIIGNVLGSSKITEKSLAGTWTYTQPCVAFESENVLSNIGGSVASSKIEDKMKKALAKAGIKEGKFTVTFNEDKTFAMAVGKKKLSGTFEVSGSDLLLTFNSPNKTIKSNAKLSLGTLQLAMNADKMLEIVNTIATKASAYSSQMGTISTVLSQYKGMYLGMKFNKK